MKKILILLAVSMIAASASALPEWKRKYATSVIRGRVINLPEGKDYGLSTWGTSNIKQTGFPTTMEDSAGVFCLKWEMCWPIILDVTAYDTEIGFYLCPGDTIDVEIDYEMAQKYKDDAMKMYKKAVKLKGGFYHVSPEIYAVSKAVFKDANRIDMEYYHNNPDKHFVDHRERLWEQHEARLKQINKSKLTKEEKELLQLKSERVYYRHYNLYEWFLEISGCDVAKREEAKKEFTLVDPHASALLSPRTTNAILFMEGYAFYLEANGLDKLPMGQYLRERQAADDLVGELKSLHDIASEDIDKLAPEFRQPIHELKAEMADKIRAFTDWKPSGEPATWLDQIVQRHKGKVVYIDFWATWCGPCNKGIQEMETVKSDYEKRGVDFVYITNNSSSTDGFLALKQKHSGDHFLFSSKEWAQMNIPDYSGSIPHYLIYGRDGRLLKTLSGWGGLERVTQELDNALAQ